MINFDDLVLAPCMAAFAIEVQISPEISRPGTKPYPARGIYTSQPLVVELQDGTVFSDQQTTLGVEISDFEHLPGRSDRVKITEPDHPQFGRRFWIGDTVIDGQGGAVFTLRDTEPK
jgi:hypothetical protein